MQSRRTPSIVIITPVERRLCTYMQYVTHDYIDTRPITTKRAVSFLRKEFYHSIDSSIVCEQLRPQRLVIASIILRVLTEHLHVFD